MNGIIIIGKFGCDIFSTICLVLEACCICTVNRIADYYLSGCIFTR